MVNLPRRPSQNEDPWFAARENYDQAVENAIASSHRTRGILRGDVHIDNVLGSEYAGTWNVLLGDVPDGVPDFDLRQRMVVEVVDGGNMQAQIQRISTQNETIWRKTGPGSTLASPNWGEWRRDDSNFGREVRVAEVRANGELVNAVGDPHEIFTHGVASITKLMTAHVAHSISGSASTLADSVEIVDDDFEGTLPSSLEVGDIVTVRALHYASLVASDNAAPNALARYFGDLLPGSGDPWDKFVREMNRKAEEMGFDGASFTRPVGSGLMSPYQVCRIMQACMEWNFISTVISTGTYRLDIEGPNTRFVTLNSGWNNNLSDVDELVGGKGGSGQGVRHFSGVWDRNGEQRVTSVLDCNPTDRYETFKLALASSRAISFPNNTAVSGQTPIMRNGQNRYLREGRSLDVRYNGTHAVQSTRDFDDLPEGFTGGGIGGALTTHASGISTNGFQEFVWGSNRYWRDLWSNAQGYRDWQRVPLASEVSRSLTRKLGPFPVEDLNDAQENQHIGIWYKADSQNLLNAPKGEEAKNAQIRISRGANMWSLIQEFFTNDSYHWRKGRFLSGSVVTGWTPWMRVAHQGEVNRSPSAQIQDLAEKDGWMAFYDVSNPNLNDEGLITSIPDRIGGFQSLKLATPGELLPNSFGQLNGTKSPFGNFFGGGTTLREPTTVMFLVEDEPPSSESKYILRTGTTGFSHDIYTLPETYRGRGIRVHHGLNELSHIKLKSGANLVSITSYGTGTTGLPRPIYVNGQLVSGTRGNTVLNGIRFNTDGNYDGAIGPVLVYRGEIPLEAHERMTSLLMSLSGITKPPLDMFPSRSVVYTETLEGSEVFSKGDVDQVRTDATIASVTKVMTAIVAVQNTTNEQLDSLVTVEESDVNSTRFQAGDQVTLRDLLYASGLMSDNTAPNLIARTVGAYLNPESTTPRQDFIALMNQEANRIGIPGDQFINPQFGATLSARQVVMMFKEALNHPLVVEFHKGSGTQDITITDSSGETRTETISSAFDRNDRYYTPGIIAHKGGSNYGFNHNAVAWEYGGITYVTSILNSNSNDLMTIYTLFQKARWAVISGQ